MNNAAFAIGGPEGCMNCHHVSLNYTMIWSKRRNLLKRPSKKGTSSEANQELKINQTFKCLNDCK